MVYRDLPGDSVKSSSVTTKGLSLLVKTQNKNHFDELFFCVLNCYRKIQFHSLLRMKIREFFKDKYT